MSELESTFIEEINPQKRKIITESIYKQPTMDLDDFNNNFLNKLLKKISVEHLCVFARRFQSQPVKLQRSYFH